MGFLAAQVFNIRECVMATVGPPEVTWLDLAPRLAAWATAGPGESSKRFKSQ